MNKENIPVITDREKLYDKCENMEQLFDKYYLPLLDKHYSKTYELQQENKQLKDRIEGMQEERDYLFNKSSIENKYLAQENEKLKDRDLIIAAELTKLQDENKQLKDNWNKLKEWLEEMINEIKTNDIYDRTEYECTQIATLENVLAKLEEIGGGING